MAKEVLVPDVGEAKDVEVIEILVAVGDSVNVDDSLVVLESDKASMEIPSPLAGRIASIAVKVGDEVDEGDVILEIDAAEAGTQEAEASADDGAQERATEEPAEKEAPKASAPEASAPEATSPEEPAAAATAGEESEVMVVVPDVGDAKEIVVAEVLVKTGDAVTAEQSLVVLESDKASMEIPSPRDGVVGEILIGEGDEVSEGDGLVKLKVAGAAEAKPAPASEHAQREAEPAPDRQAKPAAAATPGQDQQDASPVASAEKVHAGPAVRKQAREYGVDLGEVPGSGRKGRILKEDIQDFVKKRLRGEGAGAASGGTGIPAIPPVDFSKFGETELRPLSRVRRSSARNLHRSWLNVPHVTQFDEADITDLEAFRKSWNQDLAADGIKVTPLAFLVKACVNALMKYPHFNSSLDEGVENLIVKKYYNIGIAVETDDGLMVPALKDADKKGIVELAHDCAELARQAREKKLPLDAMQGATFTISSLGGIGGTAFTPIVNAPEVAILGVSRSKVVPVWDGKEFRPRTMLPFSLSYDHRAIDGAEAVRFTDYLSKVLSDIRRLMM